MFTTTGKTAPKSGQYLVLGTNTEITLSKGDKVPPYDKKAAAFVLVDKTKNSSN